MENPIEMDDLGIPIIFGNTHFQIMKLSWNGAMLVPMRVSIEDHN